MKRTITTLSVLSVILFVSCSSDSGEDIQLKCEDSDLALDIVEVAPSCTEAGSLTINASGGDGDYTYSINEGDFVSDNTFSGLNSGLYTLTVKDGLGCTVSVERDLTGLDALSLEISTSGCENGDGEIEVNVSGGDGNYLYQLNNGDATTSNIFSGLDFGTYTVTVTDGGDCTATSGELKIGVSLEADIVPIIDRNCATSGCHLDSRSPLLVTNEDIISAAERIKARTVAGTMPPSGDLPESQVQLIADWVDCGAKNN